MSEQNPYASPAERAPGLAVELAPPQEIRYQLVEEDLIAAMQYTGSRVPEFVALHRKWRLIFLVGGGVFCAMALSMSALDDYTFSSMIVAPTIVGALLLYRAAAYHRIARYQTRKRTKALINAGVMPIPDEYKRCEVSTEGIVSEEPMIRTQVGWPRVLRVSQTNEHLLIYLHPSMPIVVPGRAFSSIEHFEGFCRLTKQLWDEHHDAK